MNRKRSKWISIMIAIFVVAGVWSVCGIEKAEAIIIICKSPMLRIARGEMARSYVLNLGDENAVIAILSAFA